MAMRHPILAAVALCLSSCERVGADGYTFDRAEFTHLHPDVYVVYHPSLDDLRRGAPASAKIEGQRLMAWSVLSGPDLSTCTVHIVDPAVAYAPEWIGHEITHCNHGRWHP